MGKTILALGELLVDFTPAGVSPLGRPLYEQNPGGAPANVLVAAARQGADTALISAVGNDFFGTFLLDILKRGGTAVSGVQIVDSAVTTLAFVSLDECGEREFCFCRKPGADMLLSAEKLNKHLLENCGIFHFGSISLTADVSRGATLEAVKTAKANGALISFDPNWRENLWENKNDGIVMMKDMLPFVNLLKLSEQEAELICGGNINALFELYTELKLVVMTLGERGCLYSLNGQSGDVPGFKTRVVDTTGAGDAFWGSLLCSVLKDGGVLGNSEKLRTALSSANATGAICASGRGAMSLLPDMKTIETFIKEARQ